MSVVSVVDDPKMLRRSDFRLDIPCNLGINLATRDLVYPHVVQPWPIGAVPDRLQ
jgi:hypothetical protein